MMKIGGQVINFSEGKNTGETKAFGMSLTRQSFELLSKSIYSRPIDSIVRELASNAHDSHVRAGKKDRPFTICLPNELSPTFAIRDYGVGMTPKVIADIYSTYFESTKSNDNSELGGFGLGAKTPLSYTNQFICKSFVNGTCHTYVIHIGDTGPMLTHMGDIQTSEENGVEISFPVEINDHYAFRNAVEKELRYFTVKPEVHGQDVSYPTDGKEVMSGKDWVIRRSNYYHRDGVLILDQIGYPLDGYDGNADWSFICRAADNLDGEIVIRAKIGDVNVSVSREVLSYDRYTNDYLNARMTEIANEIRSIMGRQMEISKRDYDNPWEAAAAFAEFQKEQGSIWSFLGKPSIITLKGQPVLSTEVSFYTDEYSRVAYETSLSESTPGAISSKDTIMTKMGFYISGTPHGVTSYLDRVIFLDKKRIPKIYTRYRVTFEGDLEKAKAYLKEIGYPHDIIMASTLVPKAERVQRGLTYYKFVESTRGKSWDAFLSSSDLREGVMKTGYYFVLKNGEPVIPDRYKDIITSPESMVKVMLGLGDGDVHTPIYGIAEKTLKSYTPEATLLWDALDTLLSPDNPEMKKYSRYGQNKTWFENNSNIRHMMGDLRYVDKNAWARIDLVSDPIMREILITARACERYQWESSHRQKFYDMFKVQDGHSLPGDEYMTANYPLVPHIAAYPRESSSTRFETLIQYINDLVENLKGKNDGK